VSDRRGPRGPNEDGLRRLGGQVERRGGGGANEEGLVALGRSIDSKSPTGRTSTRRHRRTSSHRGRRIFAITAVVVVIGLIAVVGGAYVYGYYRFKAVQSGALCKSGGTSVCAAEISGKPFNVLAIGSDSRAGLPAAILRVTNGPGQSGQRSDVVKIFHVDPAAGTISVLSIPRDTVVTLLANQSQFGSYNRINVNYENGPALLIRTIEANFGITINHVVQVGFGGLAGAVDALGGIWMDFPYPALDNYSSLNIPRPGCQLLNGFQALAIARSRHYQYFANGQWNYDGTSDFGRIDRQNQFLRALIDAAKSKYNPATINAFLTELPKGIQIDSQFGYNELLGLIAKFHSFSPTGLAAYTLPTVPGVSPSLGDVLYIDQPLAQQMLVKIFGQVGTVGGLSQPTNPPPDVNGGTPPPPVVATPSAPSTSTATTGSSGTQASSTTSGAPATTTTTAPLHTEPWYTFNPVACSPR
jgi:LCP family protein required for cell wall assembly